VQQIDIRNIGMPLDSATTMPLMGLDAEVIPIRNGESVFPHQVGMKQWRPKGRSKWRALEGAGDWHGDGFAFEFCTKPVACLDEALLVTANTMLVLASQIQDVQMIAPPLYDVPRMVVETAPHEVRMLGCAPSYNIYGDAAEPSSLGNYTRSTGCHLHISHSVMEQATVEPLLRWADVLVGSAWTYISPEDPAMEEKRRRSYGRAGEHRRNIYPKPRQVFGVEYRVLPGRPATHPVYLTAMWRLYRWALRMAVMEGAPPVELNERARTAINTADAHLAEKVLAEVNFTEPTRKVLAALKAKPLPILTPAEWYYEGQNYRGVSHWAVYNT
jgi:hypothetical protein